MAPAASDDSIIRRNVLFLRELVFRKGLFDAVEVNDWIFRRPRELSLLGHGTRVLGRAIGTTAEINIKKVESIVVSQGIVGNAQLG